MLKELLDISRIRDTDKLQTSMFTFTEKYNIPLNIYSEHSIENDVIGKIKYKRKLELRDLNRFDIIFGNPGFTGGYKFLRIILKCKIENTTYEYSIQPNNI